MKQLKLFILVFLIGAWAVAETRTFTSVNGGNWSIPETWIDGAGAVPGASDDVIIQGQVLLAGTASCNHLSIEGTAAGLSNVSSTNATLNINGNLSLLNGGKILSEYSNGNYITLNLYGNFSQGGLCRPLHFNIMGTGDRHLSQVSGTGLSLAPYGNITIADAIDNLWIDSHFAFSSSNAGANSNFSSGSSYALRPAADCNLSFTNINLNQAYVLGNGSNQLIWENVRYGTLSNCILEDLSIISTDKMLISNGVTLRDVVNNTNIHNSQGNDRSLTLEGSFTNHGTLQPNPTGYQLSVISFGNLVNHGLFKPSYITFSGSGDRFMSCDPEHPFSTHNNFNIDSTVGTIHAASDLYFSDIHQINAGDFDLQEPGRLAFSIHLSNLLVQSCTFLGGTVSSLYATNLVASNSSFQSLDLNGLISFRSGCSLTNVVNHATLQNDSNNNYTLAVNGSFPNYGTLRNYPGSYNLTLDVYGNIQNYGAWTNHTTNLASTSLQSISFPQTNPCQTSYLNDTVLGSAVQAVGDIWFENCNLDLNLAVLFLDAAPSGIYIANGNLRDVDLRSVLANTIQMNAPHTITNVSFQSITNTGILTLDGDTL